jgi:peptidoglycan/xylan/chitin deacetylase (PgdA/CDA1 family)
VILKVKELLDAKHAQIVMWDVLSGDFDTSIDGEKCFKNVVRYTKPGSIIVFHDSTKAWDRMQVALPKVLQYFTEKGYRFEALP